MWCQQGCLVLSLAFFLVFAPVLGEPRRSRFRPPSEEKSKREGRLFSLFNIVQFQNDACQSSEILDGGSRVRRRVGTCFTSSECTGRSGNSQGSCAAGFGVCCVFKRSIAGASTSLNNTYFQNPDFPRAVRSAMDYTYRINRLDSSVCSLRLDFETLSIQGLPTATDTCVDVFRVTSPSGQLIPEICGVNDGQHIYLDLAPRDNSLDFTVSLGGDELEDRRWDIRVTQVQCGINNPPSSCLQYHTSTTGMIRTFNYQENSAMMQTMLPIQRYDICIRPGNGMCCVEYQVCDDNSFSLAAANKNAKQDADCSQEYIEISGSSNVCICGNRPSSVDKYCGGKLNVLSDASEHVPICDCHPPFGISIRSVARTDATMSNGLCLTFVQKPCNSC